MKVEHTMAGDLPSWYWPASIRIESQEILRSRHQDELHRALVEIGEALDLPEEAE